MNPATLPHVMGEVAYLARMAEKPYSYAYEPPPEGKARTNLVLETHVLPMHDMRPATGAISLDREGFALVNAPTAARDLYDENELKRVYYPETERIVARATGASRAVVFDHTIRRRTPDALDRTKGIPRQPVARIHGDYTEVSGPQRVRDVMGGEAGELLKHRYAIVNLWRPIKGPLLDAPLALCDATTVADGDLVTHDLIYRDRVGEIYALFYNEAHRWYYAPAMAADEALLLKCYDSMHDGRARFMPHTSFEDSTAPADKPVRESIELRTLLFFPD